MKTKAQKPTKDPNPKPAEAYLNPCPDCESKALLLSNGKGGKAKRFSVACKETWRCSKQVAWYETEDEAIAAWNGQRRPGAKERRQ